jgi:hypothetical protein
MRYPLVLAVLSVICQLPAWALIVEEEAKLLAADGVAGDRFGESVALDGDTAIIGAPGEGFGPESGSAYVFTRSDDVWTEQAKLLASDGEARDYFGESVAIDGDMAVVGSWKDDDNGDDSGSVYVFTRTGGVWTQQAKLKPADGAPYDRFGCAVALDGDTAVIGAFGDGDNGTSSGSAYVFTRTGDLWTAQAKLLPSDGAGGDQFGGRVAVDGDTVVVSAGKDDDNGMNSGSAYVFTRTGSVWAEQAKLKPADGAANDGFGIVSLDGDTVVIGSWGDDDNGSASGSAYVFTRTGDVWTAQAKLLPADGAFGDFFGASVAIDEDTAVIGAYGDDDNGQASGSAYVFTRTGDVWTAQAKLLPADGASGNLFGDYVAIDADTALIGAVGDDDNGQDTGAAYVFRLYDDDVPATSVVGLALLVLAVMGTGVYFMRRRASL